MQITDEERAHAIELLRNSREEFLSLTAGLTEAQWRHQPAPGRWSVGETAEHLILAEVGMLSRIRKALSSPPDPEWEAKTSAKTEFLEQNVPANPEAFEAPVFLQPRFQWTREETIERYQEGRGKSLQFIEETQLPLKAHLAEHPSPVFGTLNAHQWLVYIPLHNLRHNRQIANIKNSPEFPT